MFDDHHQTPFRADKFGINDIAVGGGINRFAAGFVATVIDGPMLAEAVILAELDFLKPIVVVFLRCNCLIFADWIGKMVGGLEI